MTIEVVLVMVVKMVDDLGERDDEQKMLLVVREAMSQSMDRIILTMIETVAGKTRLSIFQCKMCLTFYGWTMHNGKASDSMVVCL